MNDCAESQAKYCKAYAADFWGNITESYNRCKSDERPILKKNIHSLLDRMKYLLDNKKFNDENNSADKSE